MFKKNRLSLDGKSMIRYFTVQLVLIESFFLAHAISLKPRQELTY